MTKVGRNAVIGVIVAASLPGLNACGPTQPESQGSYNRTPDYNDCMGPGCTNEGSLDPDGNGRFDPTPLRPDRVRQYG